jgi:CBS domain-containing protein
MLADTSLHHRPRQITDDRLATPVRDIMRPGVIMLPDDASVVQAQRALLTHDVHAVLVVEGGTGRPMGWVTSRGLLGWCDRDTQLTRARLAVTEPALTIEPSATARKALELLDGAGAARLLVARRAEGMPEGVVADVDLLRLLAR